MLRHPESARRRWLPRVEGGRSIYSLRPDSGQAPWRGYENMKLHGPSALVFPSIRRFCGAVTVDFQLRDAERAFSRRPTGVDRPLRIKMPPRTRGQQLVRIERFAGVVGRRSDHATRAVPLPQTVSKSPGRCDLPADSAKPESIPRGRSTSIRHQIEPAEVRG